jgi:hypothetical protein
MPGPEIFLNKHLMIETINATTFYDIFDGYYNVTLKFNVTVKRVYPFNPKFILLLLRKENNTAPSFVFTLGG